MYIKNEGGKDSPGARRLRIVRIAEGWEKGAAWAKRLGWSPSQLSNYENGVPLSQKAAIALVRVVPGLTLDWLILGREEGLPLELRRRLAQATDTLDQQEGRSSPSGTEAQLPSRRAGSALSRD